jgi:hypothetical protein
MSVNFGQLVPRRFRDRVLTFRGTMVIRKSPELRPLLQPGFLFERKSNDEHISAILDWLKIAVCANGDHGIPQMIKLRDYATTGSATFAPSYPETTGYMLCTLIFGGLHKLKTLPPDKLDGLVGYLLRTQKDDGAFCAPGAHNVQGLAFDTGQVLTGLVAYYRHIDPRIDIKESITRAADWLTSEIAQDGSYSMRSSYYDKRAYYISATMGLLQASLALQRDDWRAAAIRNIKWTMAQRLSRVWYRNFSFEDDDYQNLHGIAYTVRGLLDAGRFLGVDEYVDAAKVCVDALLALEPKSLACKGALPGYLANGFKQYTTDISPTGMCQVALTCLILGEILGRSNYTERGLDAIQVAKGFHFSGFKNAALNGLLPGSWPITGPYMHCVLPNWPIKFFLDGLYISEGAKATALEG